MINYKNIADLNFDILHNITKFPHDIDLILGIPRSGMMPANLLALYLNKPYSSVELYLENKIFSNGIREIDKNKIFNKILVVDDSINTGLQMNKIKELLKNRSEHFIYSVIYAAQNSASMVDIYCEIINQPRVFQWNIFNHSIIQNSSFDLDGVLCADPSIDDDGPLYINEITNAPEKFIPKYTINNIVTCRLEKYRNITEQWLLKHNIKYNNLIMLNFNTKDERIKWGKHAEYKAEKYLVSNDVIFFESSLAQAKIIKNISQKDVFCVETLNFI